MKISMARPKTIKAITGGLAVFFCLFCSFVYPAGAFAEDEPEISLMSRAYVSDQTGVEGAVTDSSSLQPVSGAFVELLNKKTGALLASGYTDTNGYYFLSFSNKRILSATLRCTKSGYQEFSKSGRARFNKLYTLNINLNPLLSISVSPKSWDIGTAYVNNTVTMDSASKITITNNGASSQTLELKLTDPIGWSSSTSPAQETYVLSGLICNTTDIPQASSFASEDIITITPKKATTTIFAYPGSTANGTNIATNASRALYLQFKSPTLTNKSNQQTISITITAQTP